MKDEEKKKTAEAVLDYWLTLELLTQERIPRCKKSEIFDLKPDENIVSAEACDRITVFLGRISRSSCLEKIALKISKDEGNATSAALKKEREKYDEDPDDVIALAVLQLYSDGTYVKSSLSISPVLWIIKHDISSSEETKKSYEASRVEVEKQILEFVKQKDDCSGENNDEYEDDEIEDESDSTPAVDYETLKKVCESVASYFGVENESGYESTIRVSVKHQGKDRKDEDDDENDFSNRLSKQYYTRDIILVKEKIHKGETGDNGNALLDYINAPNEESEKNDRFDLLGIKNSDEYYEHLFEILDVENMPLGKWPSVYTTALMQQIAVNIATSEKYSGIFAGRSSIFSVNGPPGTGKTTLLQEIIVNNVVKKALLLCDVKKPDDVFEEVKVDKAFFGVKKAYRIKKEYDKLNDYGILLASNNNSAVEITSKDLLKDFSGKLKDESEHSKEYEESLAEVRELFNPKSKKSINYFRKASNDLFYEENIKEDGPERQIKFSEIENKKKDKPTWGLISAPLGKVANIEKFRFRVLGRNYCLDRNDTDNMTFSDAVAAFKKQYDKVISVRKGLIKLQTLVKNKEKAFSKKEKLEAEKTSFLEEYETERTSLTALHKKQCEDVRGLKDACENLSKPMKEYDSTQNDLTSLRREHNSIHLVNSHSLKILAMKIRHFFNVLFDKTPDAYDEELKKRDRFRALEDEIRRLSERLGSMKKPSDEDRNNLKERRKQLDTAQKDERSTESSIKEWEARKEQLEEKVRKACDDYEKHSTKLKDMLDRDYSSDSDMDKVVSFDRVFLNKMTGSTEERAEAHCQNPWETVRFKREREKLFACALSVIKHFVKDSKLCKKNLEELNNYWCYSKNKDFEGEDLKALFPAYFQSLMLFVPLVSTTFASVGRMMKNIEGQNALGTLIVDEAGQALPQMAVGALFRCRKAVVVGDPAQVEPIVNSDLKEARKAFAGRKALEKYINDKTASVQNFADILNKFGTDGISNSNKWSGTPLIIHRRCISPMFDISNKLSYNNEMIYKSVEPSHGNYYLPSSVWIDCKGKEKDRDRRNHYVREHAEKVWEILYEIFSRETNPSVFVITPFKLVVVELKSFICDKARYYKKETLERRIKDFSSIGIGTIHTFQGKEADEVIFVLGCDDITGQGTFDFVDEHIVNVAVSRAKYRLYVVGDINTWTKNNRFLDTVNQEITANLLRKLKDDNLTNADKKIILGYLPYEIRRGQNSEGEEEETFDTTVLTRTAADCQDIFKNLTPDDLSRFGFDSLDDMKSYSDDVRANLQLGMYIYYALSGIVTEEDDVSFSSILFCKAIEQQLKDSLLEPLKRYCGEFIMKRRGEDCPLSRLKDRDITIGTFYTIFDNPSNEVHILQESRLKGDERYNERWYKKFKDKLDICRKRRNDCCHPHLFNIDNQREFIDNVFYDQEREEEGIFFESSVGNKM